MEEGGGRGGDGEEEACRGPSSQVAWRREVGRCGEGGGGEGDNGLRGVAAGAGEAASGWRRRQRGVKARASSLGLGAHREKKRKIDRSVFALLVNLNVGLSCIFSHRYIYLFSFFLS